MTPSTSNIIPFPIVPVRGPVPVTPCTALTSANPLVSMLPGQSTLSEPAGHADPAADDHAAHVATVVRAAITFARRKGVALDSLPPQLRVWLLALCDAGDPTCRMVRDWLAGNRRYCSPPAGEDA
ncbi:hypothetical protein SAMN05880582_1087 [Rhizobium sp. RU20A]|uniref:hypothetical protein n=1 Tax=Rhizobium sp. RU20A TaxID=1907412 RepID=UPI000953CADB|nr:hypothetical protein [Rhizobium sp. RU20A]SIR21239.1 hypothetical protein SAMN05880582_1087 [Rhizobium sp. RU20A]